MSLDISSSLFPVRPDSAECALITFLDAVDAPVLPSADNAKQASICIPITPVMTAMIHCLDVHTASMGQSANLAITDTISIPPISASNAPPSMVACLVSTKLIASFANLTTSCLRQITSAIDVRTLSKDVMRALTSSPVPSAKADTS